MWARFGKWREPNNRALGVLIEGSAPGLCVGLMDSAQRKVSIALSYWREAAWLELFIVLNILQAASLPTVHYEASHKLNLG